VTAVRLLRFALPAAFSVLGILAVLRSLGSLRALPHLHLSPGDLWAMALVYVLFTAVRGLRFRALMGSAEPWHRSAAVGFVYSAATNIFPGGIGEFSLPVIYRALPEGAARATAALLVARVQDLLSWLPFLLLGLLLGGLPRESFLLLPFSLAATFLSAVLVFVPRARQSLFALGRHIPLPRLQAFLAAVDRAIGPSALAGPALAYTLLLRAFSIASYFFVLRGFEVPVTLAESAVGGALVALLLALPIQGIAGIGTVEVWWISVLHLYGVPLGTALVGAIGLHATTLILSVLLGLLPFLGQWIAQRTLSLESLVTS